MSGWSATWNPHNDRGERKDGSAGDWRDENQVVVLYHQRGVSPSGDLFDGEVIGFVRHARFKLSTRPNVSTSTKQPLVQFLQRAARELKETKR